MTAMKAMKVMNASKPRSSRSAACFATWFEAVARVRGDLLKHILGLSVISDLSVDRRLGFAMVNIDLARLLWSCLLLSKQHCFIYHLTLIIEQVQMCLE